MQKSHREKEAVQNFLHDSSFKKILAGLAGQYNNFIEYASIKFLNKDKKFIALNDIFYISTKESNV